VLRDGTAILIRAIRPDDRERLLNHFNALSSEARYFRFFGLKRMLTDSDLNYFTRLDFVNHVGLAAVMNDTGQERFIGVARYIVREEKPSRAEVAFAVLDEYQGWGIGTLLLEHLAAIARELGVAEFVADVMGSNTKMLEVSRTAGLLYANRGSRASCMSHFQLKRPPDSLKPTSIAVIAELILALFPAILEVPEMQHPLFSGLHRTGRMSSGTRLRSYSLRINIAEFIPSISDRD
jgi:GNAT superfamily N-acetyltransferase